MRAADFGSNSMAKLSPVMCSEMSKVRPSLKTSTLNTLAALLSRASVCILVRSRCTISSSSTRVSESPMMPCGSMPRISSTFADAWLTIQSAETAIRHPKDWT